MTYRVSSNLTMMLRLILPILWTVFFGSFAIAFFIADPADTPVLYNPIFKWGYLLCFFLFLLFLKVTFMRLLRVEFDEEYVYVSNYFKTYRYSFSDISDIKEDDWLLFKLIRIKLKEKAKFGKTIPFIAAKTRLNIYMKEHPEQFERFV